MTDGKDQRGSHRRKTMMARTAAVLALTLPLVLVSAPAWASGCTVHQGDTSTLIRATVLLPDRAERGSQVLIDAAGNIACVGPHCAVQAPQATRIDCTNAILSPGFVNAHEHLSFGNIPPVADTGIRYTHRHDWRKGTNGYASAETFAPATDPDLIAWMELRHLLAGETSMVGGSMAPGLMRNLDFAEGLEGLENPRVTYAVFPLDDAAGILRTGDCNYGPNAATTRQVTAAHAYVMHLAEGIADTARNEFRCASDPAYDTTPATDGNGNAGADGGKSGDSGGGISQDLLYANVTVQHGVGLDKAMLKTLAQRHVDLVWTPRSNLALYGRTLDVPEAMALGIPIALGTDWLFTGSMTLPREADCALTYMHAIGHALTGKQLWTMMTANGAKSLHADNRLGSIAPGMVADLILVEPRDVRDGDPYTAVATAGPGQMLAILRGGQVLSGDANIVSALRANPCDAVEIDGHAKRVCIAHNRAQNSTRTGKGGYAALKEKADATGLWPAFFATTPPLEPVCHTAATMPPSSGLR